MSTCYTSANYVALRGENCNLTTIEGVKSFVTDAGIDVLESIRDVSKVCTQLESVSKRLEEIETRLNNVGLSNLFDVDIPESEEERDGCVIGWDSKNKKWTIVKKEDASCMLTPD